MSKTKVTAVLAAISAIVGTALHLMGYESASYIGWTLSFVIALLLLGLIHGLVVNRSHELRTSLKKEHREARVIANDIRNQQKLNFARMSKKLVDQERELASIEQTIDIFTENVKAVGAPSPHKTAANRSASIRRFLYSTKRWVVFRTALLLKTPFGKHDHKSSTQATSDRALKSTQVGVPSQASVPEIVERRGIHYEGGVLPSSHRTDTPSVSQLSDNYSGDFVEMRERVTNRSASDDDNTAHRRKILLVSSNGAGLGHLTRLAAVDRWLDADTFIYTMSGAYHRLGRPSSDITYFPSHGDLGMKGAAWNVLMESHFDAVVTGFAPDLIVFDGTYVYRGVIRVSRRRNIPLVWMQRGCWIPEVDARSKQRHHAHKFASGVIIPGDYGCEETVNVGENLEPIYIPPITLVTRDELLSKRAAREALDLPEDKKLFLIQLGAGVINDITDLREMVVRQVKGLSGEWEPVLVRNPLANHSDFPDVLSIQAFPLSKYYNAFEAGAFAAGYNTVQESVELGLPGVFIPNLETKTDDQDRRARELAARGLGLRAVDNDSIEEAIRLLGRENVRGEIRKRMVLARRPDGAGQAAAALHSLTRKFGA